MVTHSSILAWKSPWTEEPGQLQSTGSQRVRHDWANYTRHSDDICVGSFVSLGQLQRIAGGQGALRRLRGCGGQPTSSSLPLPASMVPEKPARARGPWPALALCVSVHVCALFPCEISQTTSLSKLRDVHNQSGNILLTAFSLFTRLSFFSSF